MNFDKAKTSLAALRIIIGWTRDACPRLAWAALALTITAPLVTVAFTIASGQLVGAVPGAVGEGLDSPQGRSMVLRVGVVAALFMVQFTLGVVGSVVGDAIRRRVDLATARHSMAVAMDPIGVAHLEDTGVLDRMQTVRGLGVERLTLGQGAGSLSSLGSWYLGLVGSAVLIGQFLWWLPIVLLPIFWAARSAMRKHVEAIIGGIIDQTGEFRRALYYTDLALDPAAAKENRVFGLGAWLADRMRTDLLKVLTPTWDNRRSRRRRLVPALLLMGTGLAGSYALAVSAAVDGRIGLAQLTVVLTSIAAVGASLTYDNDDLHMSQALQVAPIINALRNDAQLGDLPVATSPTPAANLPQRDITFDNVNFAYPGTDNQIFDNFSLTLRAGESVAIVGSNGAGKTTLIKLLCRLYDPTSGTISVDGIDMRDLEPRQWQRRVGAIFQDFTKYELSASYNIAVGALSAKDDLDALRAAVDRAGVLGVIEAMPNGFDTTLSRRFTDGIDPSGGQWQRVALARALLAVDQGAGVLVLDEPTANLDVRAEVEIYDRFLELTRGVTTLVVSHRFSTVRRADRIVVLDAGRVVEDGSHNDLIAEDGIYARMFRLQSERFQTGPLENPEAHVA